ncbi:tetratricopeptide repeat protein [Actinocrinis puniceicyclus]|uniref:Tetratricopeptide repeat protein n=1 Tax=Actinocrinis puniceicyclus TaxID=977794 RepID=A0A8J8BAZ9_9ACTN|nr:tetratricopeptide repeat protein [Actinocrinis puniceicyclus]MBS2961915.1 tetratricopeptide repeat protein [Actinocrinis puniceicyclus]
MEHGQRRPSPGPPETPDPLAAAAATARTLEDLAALLRDLRRRHARSRRDSSLTYRELAGRTGWSHTAIAEYFTARTLPPTDRFDALLEVLGAAPGERRALASARDRIEEAGRRGRTARPAGRSARRGSPATGDGQGASPEPASAQATHPGPAPAPAPRQLPAAPRMFTGRARELAFLDAALREQTQTGGTVVVCAIGGMGGIGKTWLALHWAYRHLDRFPDGQLYVNLRGFDPGGQPVDARTVLRGFLEALGVSPSAIPVELEAQAALYRGVAADKRMLVVLDNARDTAQVAPLLPGGMTCTVLITSRRKLTGLLATNGACAVALDALPEEEARQLLARHLGRGRIAVEAEAAATLRTCCAGLPLALSIVAARAATQPDLSLTALAAELTATPGRLDALDAGEPQADLRAVLSWSGRALSPAAARAFALLGIAPGPQITPAAAASLLGVPRKAALALLRELDHAHLIQRHAADSYRMHDLLKLHAAEKAHAECALAERQAALRRLVEFYVHTACAGARLLAPHLPAPLLEDLPPGCVPHPLPDSACAIAWFDVEHASVLAAQQSAGSHGWDAQVCHLAWALEPYHRRRGLLQDRSAVWLLAVKCAQRLPEPTVRAHAHQMFGDACAEQGRTADALQHLRLALSLTEEAGDLTGQGEIHHSLGGTWERHGDDRRALEHALRALLIFRQADNPYRQARALNGVGWLQTRLGSHAEARANCLAALALLREHGDHQVGESAILDSLGHIACRMREYDEALDYLQQALTICRDRGQGFLEADILHHIAEARLGQNRADLARDCWLEAHGHYTAQHRLADARRVKQLLDMLDREPAR